MGRPKKAAAVDSSKVVNAPQPAEPSPTPSIVQPLIKAADQNHLWQDLELAGTLPVLKSIGYCQAFPNSRDYLSYVITSQGPKVISIEVSEPDLKAIAVDSAKVDFVTKLESTDDRPF